MAKEIQYSRIATKLQNLKAAHPQDVSAALWRKTFKDVINGGEAMRLFEAFAGALMLLEARNKTYLKWSDKANANNWTAKWVESIFKKYDIISKYGPTMANGKMVHPRRPKVVTIIEQPVVEAPVKEPVKLLEWVKLPIDPEQLSNEELDTAILEVSAVLNELNRVKEGRLACEAKKAELLKIFSEMAKDEGFNLEDIIGIVWVKEHK